MSEYRLTQTFSRLALGSWATVCADPLAGFPGHCRCILFGTASSERRERDDMYVNFLMQSAAFHSIFSPFFSHLPGTTE